MNGYFHVVVPTPTPLLLSSLHYFVFGTTDSDGEVVKTNPDKGDVIGTPTELSAVG